jgi:hypothetical protein
MYVSIKNYASNAKKQPVGEMAIRRNGEYAKWL